jgi:hypothetical protein
MIPSSSRRSSSMRGSIPSFTRYLKYIHHKYIHHFCSEGTRFKVVVAAVHLHFDVGLLAVVEGDVNVKKEFTIFGLLSEFIYSVLGCKGL